MAITRCAIGSGVSPIVNLSVGTHTITLTVTDDENDTGTDEVIVEVNPPGPAQALVDRLNYQSFKDNIYTLSTQYGDRCQMTGCDTTNYNNAQAWLAGVLSGWGYTAQYEPYSYNGDPRTSLYVRNVGTVHPEQMYMVACHLDGRGGGGAADDNASGCSLLMEVARVLASSDVETDVSVGFFFWGNEETGLHGSTAYRDHHLAESGNWLGNITHDMILYDHGVPAQPTQIPGADMDVEYRAGTTFEAQSHLLADAVAAAAAAYATQYPAEVNNYSTNTDDTPYHNYCPSISVRENRRLNEIYGIHPYYHTSGDVYANYSELDFQLGFNTVKMTAGAVFELANAQIISP